MEMPGATRMAPVGAAEPVGIARSEVLRSFTADVVVVEAVRSRKPLRTHRIGRVLLDRWHWPFQVGAHHPGYVFLCDGTRRVFHRVR